MWSFHRNQRVEVFLLSKWKGDNSSKWVRCVWRIFCEKICLSESLCVKTLFKCQSKVWNIVFIYYPCWSYNPCEPHVHAFWTCNPFSFNGTLWLSGIKRRLLSLLTPVSPNREERPLPNTEITQQKSGLISFKVRLKYTTKKISTNKHPSIYPAYALRVIGWAWNQSPLTLVGRRGTPRTCCKHLTGPTYREKQPSINISL